MKNLVSEKVIRLGLSQEPGWIYAVEAKGVFRVPADDPAARQQWVHKVAINRQDGYRYFVDDDGDVARMTEADARAYIRQEKLAERATPPLAKAVEPPTFALAPGETYRVLSLHGPWAWAILFAGKDIENRTRNTPHRGPILIHASSRKYVGTDLETARGLIAECSGMPVAEVPVEFPRSQLLGAVDLLDCTVDHNSPWAEEGMAHWVLANPRRLARPLESFDGKLNLWTWTCPSRMP